MKKYITLENKIYEAFQVLELNKINDEILPVNRKNGNGADKNQFFIQSQFLDNLENFFPKVIKDREEKVTGRNKPTIKNYFDLTSLLNDLSKINQEIDNNFPNADKINIEDFYKRVTKLSESQNLNTSFYIDSEIANAQNGIAFKNWGNNFKPIIKELLLPTTQIKVFLFKMKDEVCAFWQFNQEYINHAQNFINKNIAEQSIQKIYYGAPGTGKSHKVNELLKGKEERTERVTFHPEYDYASFIGGFKPITEVDAESGKEEIKYKFVPQTFTNIYVDAWNNKDNEYYLVIEEINRGNCAEIFGDIFQLLDRNSDYSITPSNELKQYLVKELTSVDGIKGIENGKMKLPSNLNILATMNTSDQSLFPMDSAFKRRWDWEYIPINYEKSEENPSSHYQVVVSDSISFSWLEFIEKVNTIIKENPNLGMDKCIGNYFIKAKDNSITLEEFINKAIFYLWNDVFKDEDDHIFEENTFYEDFFPIATKGKEKVLKILEKIGLNTPEKED